MKKKLLSLFLVLALTLAGCGAPAMQAPETTRTAETAEAPMQAPTSTEAPAEPALPVVEAPVPESQPQVRFSGENAKNAAALPLGGLAQPREFADGQKITAGQAEEIERAMRDYVGHEYDHVPDSFPVNNAASYFFYDHLEPDSRAIYDALYLAALNLYEKEYHVACTVSLDPAGKDFYNAYSVAHYALCYDHPELFWLYMGDGVISRYKYDAGQSGPSYTVYMYIEGITSTVEQQMIAFNQNVRNYLNLVDTTASQEEMALQIHDLLVHNVIYDDNTAASGGDDLAHSAYGPIIGNTSGEDFRAVCDGYSLAYLYLLQQVGIEATVVLGDAGGSPSDMGGHAWNLVKLNGAWHEVDVTWDDIGNGMDYWATLPDYSYLMEAYEDPAYHYLVTHYMYCISTDEITDFRAGSRFNRPTDDGTGSYSLVCDSCRRRDTVATAYYPYGRLMENVPVAY